MAEKEATEKNEASPVEVAPKKKGLGIGLILIVSLLVLVAAGVPTTLLVMANKRAAVAELEADAAKADPVEALHEEGSNDEDELGEDEHRVGPMFPMDTFVVNLNGGRYLRLQVQLEFAGTEVPRKFYPRIVPLRDQIISVITAKSAAELESQKGKDQLKSQIKDATNELLKREEVSKVYFTQFVIQ